MADNQSQEAVVTAALAKQAFEALEQTDPSQWYPIMKGLILATLQRLDVLDAAHTQTRRGAAALAKESKAILQFIHELGVQTPGGAQGEQVQGDVAAPTPAMPAASAVSSAPYVTDAGPVTDPQQLAAEKLMDEAMGITPPAAAAPAAPVVGGGLIPRRSGATQSPPMGVGGGGRKKRRVTDAGEVTDPAQLAAEETMDAALGISGDE